MKFMLRKYWLLGGVFACLGISAVATSISLPQVPVAPTSDLVATSTQETLPTLETKENSEDLRRNEIRTYAMSSIKRIVVKNANFYDFNHALCRTEASNKLTRKKIEYFLKNSTPISQISLINYYGVFDECLSSNVKIFFHDGRIAHISFASESETAYLSSVVDGKEVEVYFYYCEKCMH